MLAEAIKEARGRYGVSQTALAGRLNISQSVISDVENGKKNLSHDLAFRLPEVLNNDAKVKAEIAHEMKTEFFNVPVLRNIDDSPKNVLDVLVSEAAEAIKSVQDIKRLLLNKRPGAQLDEETMTELIPLEEQIGDLFAALKMHLISMNVSYGLNIRTVEARVNAKLRRKGYI
ncbi:MAG: helix-turn-helix transcriptional regulator [Caulobacteraceae bacterium]